MDGLKKILDEARDRALDECDLGTESGVNGMYFILCELLQKESNVPQYDPLS